ncbi:hypothetical protein PCK2_000640, partial [Pneumocystis canis]
DVDFTEDENIYDSLNLNEEIFGRNLDNEIESSLDTQSLADETSPCSQKDKDDKTRSTESLNTTLVSKIKSKSPALADINIHQVTNGTAKTSQTKTYIESLKPLPTTSDLPSPNGIFPLQQSNTKVHVTSSISQEVSPVLSSTSNPQHELTKSPDLQGTSEYQEKHILEPSGDTDGSLEALTQEVTDDTAPTENPSLKPHAHTLNSLDLSRFPQSLKDLVASLKTVKQRTLNPPPLSILHRFLEISFTTAPELVNSETPKYYMPSEPYPVPSYYPQVPPAIFDSPELFEKIDIDALFFVFYYQQGTYQQYLAAKELKRQAWRFHKKYLTWFQRHEEPKIITDEYESGTYSIGSMGTTKKA